MIGYCAKYKNLPLFLTYCLTKVEIGGNVVKPRGAQEKFSVAYCSYKNINFTNIGHKNINDILGLGSWPSGPLAHLDCRKGPFWTMKHRMYHLQIMDHFCYRACKSRARKRGWGQEVHLLHVNI